MNARRFFPRRRFATPLLVVQGANDPRVNRAEAEQIVIALRDRGFDVEYILAPDEGHGFARPVNNMAMFMAAEKFLAAHLGGRYQEGGTAGSRGATQGDYGRSETVTLTKKIDPIDPGCTGGSRPRYVPGNISTKPGSKLEGESMNVKMSTEIKEKDGAWWVTDELGMMLMSMKDTAVLEKATWSC